MRRNLRPIRSIKWDGEDDTLEKIMRISISSLEDDGFLYVKTDSGFFEKVGIGMWVCLYPGNAIRLSRRIT